MASPDDVFDLPTTDVAASEHDAAAAENNKVSAPERNEKQLSRDIRRAGMNLLARREHSRLELARKLHRRFSEYELIETELDKLENDQLLSDERFTESYVSYRQRAGFGPVKIVGELRERGIGDQVAGRHINVSAPVWTELAEAARVKKFGETQPVTAKERQRQQRFLQYRGFNHSHFKHGLG